jgi:hypothetical protein
VAEHYDPKALITLTIAIGQTMFFMPVALIGRPLPGRPGRDLDVAAAGTRQPGSRERGGAGAFRSRLVPIHVICHGRLMIFFCAAL